MKICGCNLPGAGVLPAEKRCDGPRPQWLSGRNVISVKDPAGRVRYMTKNGWFSDEGDDE
jgi:hypothetical protein